MSPAQKMRLFRQRIAWLQVAREHQRADLEIHGVGVRRTAGKMAEAPVGVAAFQRQFAARSRAR